MKWPDRLRRLAEPVLAGTPLVRPAPENERRRFVDEFTDEHGHRRLWDPYLLGRMLAVRQPPSGEPWLWSWDQLHGHPAPQRPGPPFFAAPDAWALEQETEKELAGLHALWWLEHERASRDNDGKTPSPLPDAVRWIMDNIQPDNATGRPWAIHAFLTHDDPDAHRYAETLLHNCLVARGRPDLLSAAILLDAARGLDAAL